MYFCGQIFIWWYASSKLWVNLREINRLPRLPGATGAAAPSSRTTPRHSISKPTSCGTPAVRTARRTAGLSWGPPAAAPTSTRTRWAPRHGTPWVCWMCENVGFGMHTCLPAFVFHSAWHVCVCALSAASVDACVLMHPACVYK